MKRLSIVELGFVVWALLLAAGAYELNRYASNAGTKGKPPSLWPAESALHPIEGYFTLVAFVQGSCGCSRATLVNLEQIIKNSEKKVSVKIVILPAPQKAFADELADLASKISNSEVIVDSQENETKTFHPMTSGQTYLYDPDHKLVFSGGITPSRGHEGGSIGSDMVSMILRGNHSNSIQESQVFGCHLKTSRLDKTDEGSKL